MKSILPNKTTQENVPPTAIANLCEPLTTKNNRKNDDLANKSRIDR